MIIFIYIKLMTVILCEKPSAAKSFASCLKAEYKNGIYESNEYKIINCVGHLFELFMPEDYDKDLKKWNIKDLPIIPEVFKYKKIKEVEKQTRIVLSVLKKHKNDKIIIATDAGREGELIARIALWQAKVIATDNMYRFWQSAALTDEVIKNGLNSAKPLSQYSNLMRQGFVRQHSDWLIGINISRLLSISSNTVLPVGRVQTCVLYEIFKRENEIKNFVPTPYFEYSAILASFEANIIAKKCIVKDGKINTKFSPSKLDLSICKNKKAVLKDIKTTKKSEMPEKLFNLTALQKAAFKYFNISPEQTLSIAQKLYEKYKCLSYPRTPSRVMSKNNVELIKNVYETFKPLRKNYDIAIDFSLFSETNKHIFNDDKLEDHHALIPLKEIPSEACRLEKDVFELVVKQFFIAFSGKYVYENTVCLFDIASHTFVANGKKTIQKGWKALVSNDTDSIDEQNNFDKIDFENIICKDIKLEKKTTKPKTPYRFDTLLAFMENPRSEDENKKLVGLGTPATRAEIIKSLITRKYIIENKKNLVVSDKGIFLIRQIEKNNLLKPLIDVSETTKWEEEIQKSPVLFLERIKSFVNKVCSENINVDKYKLKKLNSLK